MKIDELDWVKDTLFLVDFRKFDLQGKDVSDIDAEVSEFVSRVEDYDAPLNNKNGVDDTLIEESSKYTVEGICQLSNAKFIELASSKKNSESFLYFLDKNETLPIALKFEEILPELSFNRFANSVVQSLLSEESEVKKRFLDHLKNNFEKFILNPNSNRVLQTIMIETLDSEFGDFSRYFIEKNFKRLKNNLNFSKNILSIAE